jgi:hypothetical protein
VFGLFLRLLAHLSRPVIAITHTGLSTRSSAGQSTGRNTARNTAGPLDIHSRRRRSPHQQR